MHDPKMWLMKFCQPPQEILIPKVLNLFSNLLFYTRPYVGGSRGMRESPWLYVYESLPFCFRTW